MTATRTRRSILDERGGPLGAYTFDPADRSPASWLIIELRNCAGSADGRDFRPDRGGWRTLRECSPELLERAVRRVERTFAGWSLPGDGDVFARIERFFEAARR